MTDLRRAQLLAGLVSDDWRVRQEAIRAVRAYADQADTAELAREMLEVIRRDHANLSALNGALQALEQIGLPFAGELASLLHGPDLDLRIYVPLVLGELGGEAAVAALMDAAEDPRQPENVRFNAVEALGKLRAREALPVLMRTAQSATPFLQYAAVSALGMIGSPDAETLLTGLLDDPYLAEPAAAALGEAGGLDAARALGAWLERPLGRPPAAVSAAAGIYRRAVDGERIRETFMMALGMTGRAGLGTMVGQVRAGMLPDGCPGADLAVVLGWLLLEAPEDAAVRDALERLLRQPAARAEAEKALLAAPGPAGQALFDLLDGEDAEAAYAAARILAAGGSSTAADRLAELLASEDETLAGIAVEGLRRLDGEATVKILLNAIEDARPYVRGVIIRALAEMPADLTRAGTERLLTGSTPEGREAALRLLALSAEREGAKETSAAVEALKAALAAAIGDPSPVVRGAAAGLLRDGAALAQALRDPEEAVRRAAARASAGLPAEAALPLLRAAIADTSHWVRLEAARGLSSLALQEGIEDLAGCLEDPFPAVRAAAAEGMALLVRMGVPGEQKQAALAALRAHLDDPDERTRAQIRAVFEQEE